MACEKKCHTRKKTKEKNVVRESSARSEKTFLFLICTSSGDTVRARIGRGMQGKWVH